MRLSVARTAKICPIEIAANISACVTGKPAQLHGRPYSPKLPPALAGLLRFRPSRLGRSRNRSSPGSTPLYLGLLNSFPLCRHSLCNPGSNVGKSLGAHLPSGFLCRLCGWRCPFDPRPSCLLSRSHLGSGGCTEFVLPGCFSRLGRSGCLAAQELTKFFLQRLNPFLDVGCFTELFW
jgi:hypothetical protein